MFHPLTKYFFIVICSFYLYRKFLNFSCSRRQLLARTIYSALLSLLTYFIRLYISIGGILILIIAFTVINYLLYKYSINVTIVSSILAMGCSYVLFLLSALIVYPSILLLSQALENTAIYDISFLLIGCCQLIIATIPFRFNRLKNGMPFLKQPVKSELGVFIAISALYATSLFYIIKEDHLYLLIPIFFIALSGILIFFWWKHKITESYLTKLKEREVNVLKKEIAELKEYNATLDKVIHKDNKLIPTMVYEVQEALTIVRAHGNQEDCKVLETSLLKLQTISKERKGIVQFSDHQAKTTYITGSSSIDGILKFLAAKAYANQTFFEVVISQNVQTIIPDIISEADFRTLVADLVENALIAVKSEPQRNVLFHTRMEDHVFYVDIYDSGAAFDKEVLENLGKNAITTHKNDGGSGIGYMSTFEILNRCNGGLDIKEDLEMDTYTKRVTVYFRLAE